MPFIQESVASPGASQEQHIRILEAVARAIDGIHVTDVAIVAGGTGYTVGDVVTMTSTGAGTAITQGGITFTARLIVTSVASGVVDGLRVESAGAYSDAPDPTAASIATTGGTGSGLTVSPTILGPYEATPDVGNEGSSYAVGDVVTVTGFTGSVDPTFYVTGVTSGAVDTLVQKTLGTHDFDEIPLTASATTTGGGGTGLQVEIAQVGWKTQSDNYTDDETDMEWIARGTNLAGAHPYVGIKTFTSGANPQWAPAGFSGFSAAATFETQPGSWPNHVPAGGATTGGVRVPLSTSGVFELFLFVNNRRVIVVARQSPAYEMVYLGLFNPFVDSPATKYPLPLLVSGTTQRDDDSISDGYNNTSNAPHAALPHHGAVHCYFRWIDGTWKELGIDSFGTGDNAYLWPYVTTIKNNPAPETPDPDGVGTFARAGSEVDMTDELFNDANFAPLPFGTGGKTYVAPPYTLIDDVAGSGVSQVVGELDGVYQLSRIDTAAEDRVAIDGDRQAVVFPNINASDRLYAILEE